MEFKALFVSGLNLFAVGHMYNKFALQEKGV